MTSVLGVTKVGVHFGDQMAVSCQNSECITIADTAPHWCTMVTLQAGDPVSVQPGSEFAGEVGRVIALTPSKKSAHVRWEDNSKNRVLVRKLMLLQEDGAAPVAPNPTVRVGDMVKVTSESSEHHGKIGTVESFAKSRESVRVRWNDNTAGNTVLLAVCSPCAEERKSQDEREKEAALQELCKDAKEIVRLLSKLMATGE